MSRVMGNLLATTLLIIAALWQSKESLSGALKIQASSPSKAGRGAYILFGQEKGADSVALLPPRVLNGLLRSFKDAVRTGEWDSMSRYQWTPLLRFNKQDHLQHPYPRGYLVCRRSIGPFFRGLIEVRNRKTWDAIWRFETAHSAALRKLAEDRTLSDLRLKYYYDVEHGYRPGVKIGGVIIVYPYIDRKGEFHPEGEPDVRYLLQSDCEVLRHQGFSGPDRAKEWRMLATYYIPGLSGEPCAEGNCFLSMKYVRRLLKAFRWALVRKSWTSISDVLQWPRFDVECLDNGTINNIYISHKMTNVIFAYIINIYRDIIGNNEKYPSMKDIYIDTIGPKAGKIHFLRRSTKEDFFIADASGEEQPLFKTALACGEIRNIISAGSAD